MFWIHFWFGIGVGGTKWVGQISNPQSGHSLKDAGHKFDAPGGDGLRVAKIWILILTLPAATPGCRRTNLATIQIRPLPFPDLERLNGASFIFVLFLLSGRSGLPGTERL